MGERMQAVGCDFRDGLPEKVVFVQRAQGGKFKTEEDELFVTERNWDISLTNREMAKQTVVTVILHSGF